MYCNVVTMRSVSVCRFRPKQVLQSHVVDCRVSTLTSKERGVATQFKIFGAYTCLSTYLCISRSSLQALVKEMGV